MSGSPNRDYEDEELRRRRDTLEDVGDELMRRQARRLEGGERRPKEVRWQAHRGKEQGESPTGRAKRGRGRERARCWPVVERGKRSAREDGEKQNLDIKFYSSLSFSNTSQSLPLSSLCSIPLLQARARFEKVFYCFLRLRNPFVASLLALNPAETLLTRPSPRTATQKGNSFRKNTLSHASILG